MVMELNISTNLNPNLNPKLIYSTNNQMRTIHQLALDVAY